MKMPRFILTILLLISFTEVESQDVVQPFSPVLDRVTVDPGSGFTYLSWLPGGSPDVSCHVIYTYFNNIATAVDTVRPPDQTSFVYEASAARYKSEAYVVAAMDSARNISPLSNSLSTIYLSLTNDTCNGRIHLSWTPYLNPAHPATGYGIYMSLNGAVASLHHSVGLSVLSFDLEDYLPDSQYCFYVAAVNNSEDLASSNMQCAISGSEAPPYWTEIESIAAENGIVTLNCRYDPDTDITSFLGEKRTSPSTTWQSFGTEQGSDGMVILNDFNGVTDSIHLYRFSAINNCGNPVAHSLPVRNIVLKCLIESDEVLLTWNRPYTEEPAIFSIWRDTGDGYSRVAEDVTDTLWTDDYRAFAEEVSTGSIRYYVTAVRSGTPAGGTKCRSQSVSVSPVENVFMANAFTPDNDGLNDTFAPVLSFTPVSYDLRIYSRQGILLFSTTSYGIQWDGHYNGRPMPTGAYLWNLRITPPSGKIIQKSGTVTILY